MEDVGGTDALDGEVNHVWSFDLCPDLLLATSGVFLDGEASHVWSFDDLCADLLLATIGVFLDGEGELSVVGLTVALRSALDLAFESATTSHRKCHTLLEG